MALTDALMLAPALLYLTAALAQAGGGWPLARQVAWTALALSAAAPVAVLTGDPGAPSAWLSAAPLNLVMSVLISLIALVVIRYSGNYLDGDSAVGHYRRWLLVCLAAVSLVVISNHLLILWLAWTTISVSLHQLLVSYPDRFRAVLAAHKKFLFARIAESCLLVASLLLWQHHGTFHIDTILARYPSSSLSPAEQTAAVLLALAALFKCAQLPVHGWLIQVVEAPTPVSALLHAGVINLGGFLMILMAPLMAQSLPARWLLLVVAGLTTVLAALIMMTRISIKVRLAWSTSAQMGLMLVECALGLHELALLHLLAHSCYKAHAFLSAGTAVQTYLRRQLAPTPTPGLARWAGGLVVSLTLVGATLAALHVVVPHPLTAAELALWLLMGIAISLWLAASPGITLWALLTAPLLVLAYSAQKLLLAPLVPAVPDAGLAAGLWVAALCALLLLGYGLLVMHQTALGFRWRQWLFAGLYLDEWVTRTTLRLWPVRLPLPASRKQAGYDLLQENSRRSNDERMA
ncbi:MAG: NADH-quinone oxidoreductase subunit L [Alcanivoracaceae bacterium]|jgi:NAD(P)H-quinone oxidoreductase subunit 5|nr:NADH-quinone oxidoreductase subunit L [Alcanivoracaceae bacterium]